MGFHEQWDCKPGSRSCLGVTHAPIHNTALQESLTTKLDFGEIVL